MIILLIPIVVTLVGIVTAVSDVQSKKAPLPGNSMVRVSINITIKMVNSRHGAISINRG